MAEAKKPNIFVRVGSRIGRFFKELKSEMKKVVWPTRSQVTNNTLIVIACVLLVGALIWIVDFGLGEIIQLIS